MLPFTTYQIPESATNQTEVSSKQLLIVLNFTPSSLESILLQKMVSALKLDFEAHVATYIHQLYEPKSASSLISSDTKLMISFGVDPHELGLFIDLHTPGIRFLEDLTFILTLSLADLDKQPNAKKELWRHMQHYLEMN